VGAGPQVRAGVEDEVGPRGVGLEPMMSSTQRREIARGGRTTLAAWMDVVTVARVVIGPTGWQERAGLVHQGKTQDLSRRATCSAIRTGTSSESTSMH
jgi:hypothetical protein